MFIGYRAFTVTVFTLGLFACSEHDQTASTPSNCETKTALEGPCTVAATDLKMNDIQSVGSHNSYKKAIPAPELAMIRATSNNGADSLDYAHLPVSEQLDLGMRQIELDVFYDPEGGRYADPLLPRMTAGQPGAQSYDASGMETPGYKVLHIQDIDVHSHCATFIACLTDIKAWSDAHQDHIPILIMLNAKDAKIQIPGAVEPIPFSANAADALDAEILSVFGPDRLITPDDVRGDAPTLREGALAGGWPDLDAARGKVLFALDESAEKVTVYMRERPSLKGLPMFIKSIDESAPHAAYFTLNNPLKEGERIKAAVEAGFVVRTRADANTKEARTGDTARREAAFASGAQYISTDYYQPRTEWSAFFVTLPGDSPARCNPVRRDQNCKLR